MYNNGNSSKNVTGASVVDGTLENADFADNTISGDKIDAGIISNFQSTGIDDRLATSKVLTLSDTNTKLSGSISFNNDTVASNMLDDYEEGIWTPTLGGNVTINSGSWVAQGYYTKIGDIVTCSLRQTGGDISWGVSINVISNLPFSAPTAKGNVGICTNRTPNITSTLMPWTTSLYAASSVSNQTTIIMSITYRI
jgi:hypothetical protein